MYTMDQKLTSHALGGLTASGRCICSSEQRADVEWRHGHHLERVTSYLLEIGQRSVWIIQFCTSVVKIKKRLGLEILLNVVSNRF